MYITKRFFPLDKAFSLFQNGTHVFLSEASLEKVASNVLQVREIVDYICTNMGP